MLRTRLEIASLLILTCVLVFYIPLLPSSLSRLSLECHRGESPFEREFGRANLRLSRSYEGSLTRLEKFMGKIARREPVIVSVVGGSVTSGHHVYPNEIWFSHLTEWIQTIAGRGTNVTAVNGATAATGSDYYSYCYPLHISPESDLVLVELGINDSGWEGHVQNMEDLLRGLLDMESEPAVILVEALAFANGGVGGGGGRMHLPVAQYYDVPIVSQRHPLTGHFGRYPELVDIYFARNYWGYPDTWHLNARGQRDLGMLVASLLHDVACSLSLTTTQHIEIPEASLPWSTDDDRNPPILPGRFMNSTEISTLPRLGVLDGWNPDTTLHRPLRRPNCISEQSPDKSTALIPVFNEGWSHWVDPSGQTKPYFTANEPGSKVTFETLVGKGGKVEMYSMRSWELGLGNVRCWLDDKEAESVVVVGYWEQWASIGRLAVIGENVQSGPHKVTCELLKQTNDPEGRTEFRMIAIMSS